MQLTLERREMCRVLVEKQEETRSLGKPRLRWENNIKSYRIGWVV
jgi:hypothetical protein